MTGAKTVADVLHLLAGFFISIYREIPHLKN